MNIDKEQITLKLQKALSIGQQHLALIIIVLFCSLYGYIILQISAISNNEPDEAQVSEQIQAVSKPKVNEQTAEIIQGLQDQNVNVQAIFNEARDNPFSE